MSLEDFTRDPLGFAKKHPLVFRHSEVESSEFLESERLKLKQVVRDGEPDPMYQVRGADRIIWFDLIPSPSDPRTWQIDLRRSPRRGYVPAYWLPWAPGQVMRITLRPSSKSTEGVDPDFFFTAAVTGCSVFVEGPMSDPTVYHANAIDHAGTFEDQRTREQFVQLQMAKIEEMRARFSAFSEQFDRVAKNRPTQGVGEVNMKDYLSTAIRPDIFKDELAVIVKSLFTNAQRQKMVIDRQKITVTDAEGTIFGRRESGEWEFFYQKRIHVQYLVNEYQSEVARQTLWQWATSWIDKESWKRWWAQTWKKREGWVTLTAAQFHPDDRVFVRD